MENVQRLASDPAPSAAGGPAAPPASAPSPEMSSTLGPMLSLNAPRRRWFLTLIPGMLAASGAMATVWFAIPTKYIDKALHLSHM